MSSTINADPESINAYRQKIAHAAERLQAQIVKTEVAIENVNQSWKDQVFMEFRNNFNVDKEQIKPLCDVLNIYDSEILYNLEQKLRIYLSSPTHL